MLSVELGLRLYFIYAKIAQIEDNTKQNTKKIHHNSQRAVVYNYV